MMNIGLNELFQKLSPHVKITNRQQLKRENNNNNNNNKKKKKKKI
jgi:hypothetical protein